MKSLIEQFIENHCTKVYCENGLTKFVYGGVVKTFDEIYDLWMEENSLKNVVNVK